MENLQQNSSKNEEIRVRFAPSPTGFLHVGGARTAIFNWLFAKNRNGKFLIRIEDTDPERSKSELTNQIIRSLNWLNIISDEPIVYQSDNLKKYKDMVKFLLENNKAYYSFETPEVNEKKWKDPRQFREFLKLSRDEIKQFLSEGKEYAIRFLIPDGITSFEDIVHGKTIFKNSEIDDFILLRSDGSPVYQIAVVVDDHDMRITHVIRGDDHLSNTPKQILLYRALGWEVPAFAHLPLILDEEKKKLSKRRNTVSIEEYRTNGYLQEALFNFLTLLGYAPPDGQEIISQEDLIKVFSFERVNKKSAVFDTNKLKWINSEYIKSMSDEDLTDNFIEWNRNYSPGTSGTKKIDIKPESKENPIELYIDSTTAPVSKEYLVKVIQLLKNRASTLNDLYQRSKYFFIEPTIYDKEGLEKYWNEDTKKIFPEFMKAIQGYSLMFEAEKLESFIRQFVDTGKIKIGIVVHPLRLALTGNTISPGIFDVMEVLGKEIVLRRIEKFFNTNKQ